MTEFSEIVAVLAKTMPNRLCRMSAEFASHNKAKGTRGLEDILKREIAEAFTEAEFAAETEIRLSTLGVPTYWAGRNDGRLDLYLSHGSKRHAAELKVVKLPHEGHENSSASLYDIGQISADYMRLSQWMYWKRSVPNVVKADISTAIIVIAVHGDFVNACPDAGCLMRELHNRFFLKWSMHVQVEDPTPTLAYTAAALKWMWPYDGRRGENADKSGRFSLLGRSGAGQIGLVVYKVDA